MSASECNQSTELHASSVRHPYCPVGFPAASASVPFDDDLNQLPKLDRHSIYRGGLVLPSPGGRHQQWVVDRVDGAAQCDPGYPSLLIDENFDQAAVARLGRYLHRNARDVLLHD